MIDWKKTGWEAANMLSEMVRIDSTNPPGNEIEVCRYLEPRLKALGLDTEIVESEKGRGSIIGRLRAENPQAGPLLLLSHIDVVPADPEGWTHPPFAGTIDDGYVWGRGTLDCKNSTVAEYAALKAFIGSGAKPTRDIIIAGTADEEAGGEKGVSWLLDNRPELLQADYCINEGGGFGVSLGDEEIYFCQAAEKGVCWFKLTSRGEPGHASIPQDNTAMDRMLDALAAIRKIPVPISASRIVRKLAEEYIRAAGGNLAEGLEAGRLADVLINTARSEELRRIFKALFRNSITVTGVHGGTKTNVIPGKVEATIDCRLVPGVSPGEMLESLKSAAEPFDVKVEPVVTASASEIDAEGEFYDALEKALKTVRKDASLAPFMVPGGTDGRFLVDRGMTVYGFIPVLAEAGGGISMLTRAHGIDERIGINDLAFGSEVIYNVLRGFCAHE